MTLPRGAPSRRGSGLLCAGAALLFLLPACRSAPPGAWRDAGDVNAVVESRIGLCPPLFACPDDGAVSEAVQAMLAEPLTDDAAVRVGLLNNREVRAAYEELGIARAELVQAGLLRNPTFDGDAKVFSGGTEVELAVAQPFLDAFFIPLRTKVARAELARSRAGVARRVVAFAFEVRRALVAKRAADAMVAMHRRVLDVAAGSFDLMRHLHAAGNVTDRRLAEEEAPMTRARLELAAAESAAIESREPVNVLLGLWGGATEWTLAPSDFLEVPAEADGLANVESRAVAASFDLAESRAGIEKAAQRAGLVSWEGLFPGAEAGVAVKREPAGDWGVGPAIGAEIPVFDQGQARAAAASAELRGGLARHAALAVEVRSAARTFRERVIALGERVRYLEKVHLPVHRRLLQETIKSFNAMQVGGFDVLVARQQEIEAEREIVESLRDLRTARLDLAELLAGSLNRGRLEQEAQKMRGNAGSPRPDHSGESR